VIIIEILELPLEKHYCIFTFKGFATIFYSNNEDLLEINDLPLRFCINTMVSDPSNTYMIQAEKHFHERFKFYAIKYFGMPILADMRFKDVLNMYEKPLEDLLEMHNFAESIEIEKALLKKIDPTITGMKKNIRIKRSPLFVFTRNGLPDLD